MPRPARPSPAARHRVHGAVRASAATIRLEREFATLASLAAATSAHRTADEIAAAALEVLCRATGADGGVIIALDGDRYDVLASAGIAPTTVDHIERVGRLGGRLAAVVSDPDAVATTSLDDAPFDDEIKARVAADGLRHLVFTGMRVAGRLVGLLGLAWRTRPATMPSDGAMRQAAALVAGAVEHGRLDSRLGRALEAERTLTAGLQTLVRLTRLTASVRGETSFADLALAEITRTLGASGGVVLKVAGDRFETLAARNVHPAIERLGSERSPSDWGFVRRLRHGEGPHIGAFSAATLPTAAAADVARYATYAVVPVRADDALESVVVLLFAEPIDELAIDARTLGAVERILEIAIANQRLRRALAASERRYRSLFERSPVGLVLSGPDGVIVEANDAAEATYGFGPGELTGRPMRSLSADSATQVDERGAIVAATGGGRFDATGRRSDGSTFPSEITIAGFEVDGRPQYVLMVRDLSESRRLQDELVQAQKMDAMGQLVAGVAHELNNPLASIVGFSQLIRDDPDLAPNLRENADLLVREADRTRHIVGNLLDFARRRPPERVPTSVAALVRNVVELSTYSLRAARIEVALDTPADLPAIPIDRPQLQQVLLNLTTNTIHAIRGTGRPGRLLFRARSLGGDPPVVRLSVIDDGPGVAPDLRDRLFAPFFTTKPPGEGTGLGLSVSAGIVESHGGRLSFEPGRPSGAVFHLDLPAERVAAPTEAESSDLGDAALVPPGSPRVLVLDDEPTLRTFLDKALRSRGFDPVVVATGEAAVDAARDDAIAAVLCDYRMAGMTGTEVFDSVTALRPDLRPRFVFMSGDVLNADLHAFATARGIGLLAKPFDISTVERVVREATSESAWRD